MVYKRQFWNDYDENKSETQNIENGAVVTSERMNLIEDGIYENSAESVDLKRQIENTQSGIIGEFDSESDLIQAYPKGAKGYAIVWIKESQGKTGYSYTYKNSKWIKGQVWNGIGIGKESITSLEIKRQGVINSRLWIAGEDTAETLNITRRDPFGNLSIDNTRVYTDLIEIKKEYDGNFDFKNFNDVEWACSNEQGNTLYGWSQDEFPKQINTSSGKIYFTFRKTNNRKINDDEFIVFSQFLYFTNKKTVSNFKVANKNSINNTVSALKSFDLTDKSKIEKSVKNIEVGQFHQEVFRTPDINVDDLVSVLVYSDYKEYEVGDRHNQFQLRERNNENKILNNIDLTSIDNGIFYGEIVLSDVSNNIQLLLDNRLGNEVLRTEFIRVNINDRYIPLKISTSIKNDVVKYVRLDGNDSNDGTTSSKPLKTFQKAIDLGAEIIYAERGIYNNQSLVANNLDKLHIIPLPAEPYNQTNNYDVPEIVINNGQFFFRNDETIQKIAFGGNKRFNQVFINKTLPPKTTSSRPSFNAGLWQIHEALGNDILLEPVLSLFDCEAKEGSFFWDGSQVYVHPKNVGFNISGFTIHNDIEKGINLNNISDLKVDDLVVNFSYQTNIIMHNCKILLQNIKSNYTVLGDGISYDNSNGNIYRAISNYARNDGHNLHGFGDTHFWYCEGHYNGDDGISHHDGCTGSINYGHFSHNAKGGIAPTYGSIVPLTGNYCHDNGYGCYVIGSSDNQKRTVRHFDNIFINNKSFDYLINDKYTILSKGNVFNTIQGESNLIKLGE